MSPRAMSRLTTCAGSLAVLLSAAALRAAEPIALSEANARALAQAAPPSVLSPLDGLPPGDAAPVAVDAALKKALCDPDQVWTLRGEVPTAETTWILISAGQAWVGRAPGADLLLEGPFDAPDAAAFVAGRLGLPGPDVTLRASGEIGDDARAVLRRLLQSAPQAVSAADLSEWAAVHARLSPTGCRGALESLEQFGWIRMARAQPEPLWELARPEAAAALVHPDSVTEVSHQMRGREAVDTAVFCSTAHGTLVRVDNTASGLPAPRVASAAEFLGRLHAVTSSARRGPPPPPATASPAPGPAARTTPIGDEILAELQQGVFRLSQATATRDAFDRGQIDTWRIDRLAEYQDTTGTGAIDFVKIDDFGAGRWSRSFILIDGQWQSSNIVDVFLEIEFKLPWDRSAYHPHNVQVLLNGKEVARMEDVVPEGVHRFPLRPQDVRLPTQAGARNEVRLVTTHLSGGHYVVSTAFNLCFQLAEVTRYVIADNEKDAARILAESGNLVSGGVDAALYSNEWTVSNDRPKDGEPVKVRGLARNLGGAPIRNAALILKEGDKVLARGEIAEIPAADLVPAELEFAPGPGEHRWTLSLEATGDARAGNHAVPLVIRCGGDDVKPTLEIAAPAEGSEIAAGPVTLSGAASDNVALGVLEYSLDGGLWTAIAPGARWETPVTLAAGKHRIRVRCTDTSGNAAEVVRNVTAK